MLNRRYEKDAYRVFLYLRASVSLLTAMIFTINLIYHASVAQLTPLQLILAGTALEVSILLFEVPTGIVADVYSRRLSVVIGYAIMGLGFIVEGSNPTFVNILIGQATWGLGYTFTSGALQAWFVDEMKNDSGRVGQGFMRADQAGQIAGIVGIILGVVLASVQINLPIILGGAFLVVLAISLALIMPEHHFQRKPREERESWRHMASMFRDGFKQVRRSQILLIITAIVFIGGLYSEGYDRLWTKHFLDNVGVPLQDAIPIPVWWGLFSIGGMIIGAIATEIVRRRVKTDDQRRVVRVLWGFSLMQVIGMFAFALSGSFVVGLLAMWTANLFRGLQGPLFDTWSNANIGSENRATVLSMISQTDAIGQIAGGPGVGVIGNLWGVRGALMISSLMLVPILYLYGRARSLVSREPAVVEVEVSPVLE